MNHVLLSVFTCNYTCQSHTNYCGAGGVVWCYTITFKTAYILYLKFPSWLGKKKATKQINSQETFWTTLCNYFCQVYV